MANGTAGTHAALHARHQAVLPDWLATYYAQPIELTHGEGRHVWDAEGNRYLDFFGGILTTMTAHALPEVAAAVADQAGRLLHSSTLYLSSQAVELAERIARLSGIPDARVFFTTSGTEANDTALLLATSYRRSNQILALRNSYHGRSFSAIGITGNSAWSPTSLSPLQTLYVHGGVRSRGPYAHLSDAEFVTACVADLEDVLGQAGGTVAALIAEPVQGVGGFTLPPDGLFAAFKQVLDRHGILWITDEVQTGWGRTGEHFWGWQAHGEAGPPDILTFAKGIGNGMSMGGVVARAEVMNCLTANSISTFGGSPVTAAAALANLGYLIDHDLPGNARRVGGLLKARLESVGAGLGVVREVRGRGLMLGVELVVPGTGQPSAQAAGLVLEAAREQGLLIGKGGRAGNVLRIAPPLSLTVAEAEEGAAALEAALKAAQTALESPAAAGTGGITV
ncbi:aspartate aminotransferase family protein [Actinacidiphila bryophytorum]|uniref:alanine--glyoxylate transaminase n=1 Tax=Actinacidiphila bryophytorum TaxID=1436133 RepID=A0A9W4MEJ8_9ACTN|nr:aspartate aminotransferase family protein [Actinacidiphila bryophytorum]MBM9438533.1 aspartate aminotransferase family protein [Actinacidiphila bryophytorum]MBN6546929.1 aspartate aminotransferase family protein [Actinacidiphila bryophytorum]CAG7653467.1 4-aminobutyrate aminotransferase [Actinacidiphila bryophytorum]